MSHFDKYDHLYKRPEIVEVEENVFLVNGGMICECCDNDILISASGRLVKDILNTLPKGTELKDVKVVVSFEDNTVQAKLVESVQ